MLFYNQIDTERQLEAWDAAGGSPQPAMPIVSVDNQRSATLSAIPAGTSATDYEYQLRPAPAVSGNRQVDMSQTLAPGESPTDYEYQVR